MAPLFISTESTLHFLQAVELNTTTIAKETFRAWNRFITLEMQIKQYQIKHFQPFPKIIFYEAQNFDQDILFLPVHLRQVLQQFLISGSHLQKEDRLYR